MSMLFTPFYLPFVGLVALFLFSYLSIFPWPYKLQVLTMVYLFTILMPTVMIHLYRRYQGWNLIELGHRERRMVPYVISIICYFTCVYVMSRMHMPHFMEDFHAHSGHRWCGRRAVCLCRIPGLQPRLVALSHLRHCRHGGHQPHDSAPALAGPGRRWLLGRLPLRSHRNTFPIIPIRLINPIRPNIIKINR